MQADANDANQSDSLCRKRKAAVLDDTLIARGEELAAVVSGGNPYDFQAIKQGTEDFESYLKSKQPHAWPPAWMLDDIKRKVGLAISHHDCSGQCSECTALNKSMKKIEGYSESSRECTKSCAESLNWKSEFIMHAHTMRYEEANRTAAEAQLEYDDIMSKLHAYEHLLRKAQIMLDEAHAMERFYDSTKDAAARKTQALKEMVQGMNFDVRSIEPDDAHFEDEQVECFERVVEKLKDQVTEFNRDRNRDERPPHVCGFTVAFGIKNYLLHYQHACMDIVEEVCYLALQKDDPLALALCYSNGFFTFKKDIDKAMEIATMLSKLHSDCVEISFVLYQCLQSAGKATAMTHLEKAAQGGLHCAQVEMFSRQDIALTDRESWLKKATNSKIPVALRLSAEQERAKARYVTAMKEACDSGDLCAKYQMGICYKDGLGVPKDPETAAKYFCEAANAPHFNKKGQWTYGISAAMYEYALILLGDLNVDGILYTELFSPKEGSEWMMRASHMQYGPAVEYVRSKWPQMMMSNIEKSDDTFCTKPTVRNSCRADCTVQLHAIHGVSHSQRASTSLPTKYSGRQRSNKD